MGLQKLGPRGEALIKARETLSLVAFKPTQNDVWTIGWGRTAGVKQGDTCTAQQAQIWFDEDTAEAAAEVNALRVPLSQAMFDALVSLVYNTGGGAILAAHVIGDALRRRDWYAAWAGFTLWHKQAGHDVRGLAIRRSQEMALFMEDQLP